MTLGYAQGAFIPSWPDGQRTTDDLTRMTELRSELYPGTAAGRPIAAPNVILALLGLGAVIWFTHHLGKGRGRR